MFKYCLQCNYSWILFGQLLIILIFFLQRARSNQMPFWYLKIAYLIIFTTRAIAGRLDVGTQQLLMPVKREVFSCVPSRCFFLVEFHFSAVLNLFAVLNISKVSDLIEKWRRKFRERNFLWFSDDYSSYITSF